jgi:hypothetical protein
MQKMIAGDPASRPAWDTLELFACGALWRVADG